MDAEGVRNTVTVTGVGSGDTAGGGDSGGFGEGDRGTLSAFCPLPGSRDRRFGSDSRRGRGGGRGSGKGQGKGEASGGMRLNLVKLPDGCLCLASEHRICAISPLPPARQHSTAVSPFCPTNFRLLLPRGSEGPASRRQWNRKN